MLGGTGLLKGFELEKFKSNEINMISKCEC